MPGNRHSFTEVVDDTKRHWLLSFVSYSSGGWGKLFARALTTYFEVSSVEHLQQLHFKQQMTQE